MKKCRLPAGLEDKSKGSDKHAAFTEMSNTQSKVKPQDKRVHKIRLGLA